MLKPLSIFLVVALSLSSGSGCTTPRLNFFVEVKNISNYPVVLCTQGGYFCQSIDIGQSAFDAHPIEVNSKAYFESWIDGQFINVCGGKVLLSKSITSVTSWHKEGRDYYKALVSINDEVCSSFDQRGSE
jgi:hypothetical protein